MADDKSQDMFASFWYYLLFANSVCDCGALLIVSCFHS